VPSISLTIPANTAMIPNEKGLSIENIVFKFVVDGTVYSKNAGIGSKFIVSKLDNGKYKLFP
ncbi:MAG: hypothetical protein FWD60_11825, partial [Candidatus Azobacteroides sp.]|nr:hypothetical protein [Candidatus Azobacteroides sp.]